MSLVALLATPQTFDGKLIRVEGFFDGSHNENCRLFLSRDDFDYYIARNSIYVRWPDCLNQRSATGVQRRYTVIEGVFQADIGADFGSFSAIREVRRLEPLRSRAEFNARISPPWWLNLWPWLPLGVLFVVAATAATYLIARRVQRIR